MEHGLQFDFGFTWSKSMDTFGGTPDVQNRGLAKAISSLDQPLVTRVGFTYSLPKWGPKARVVRSPRLDVERIRLLRQRDSAGSSRCQHHRLSGGPGFGTDQQSHVPDGSVLSSGYGPAAVSERLNCHCFDPNTTFVLNPAAWANPAPGQYGGPSYYPDFRGERRPVENFAFGRQFRIRERYDHECPGGVHQYIQSHLFEQPDAASASPQTAAGLQGREWRQRRVLSPASRSSPASESINTSTVLYPPRTGQLVAQFQF